MTSARRSDQAGATLDLRVLGPFSVLHQGKALSLPPSRKTRALLAYLAVVDEPQRRERLCRMFWDTPDDLRGALRWSLSKIRQVVNIDGQDVLAADRDEVTLRRQSIALDLRQVRVLSDSLLSADIASLEQAAGALEGGFLENLSLPRCREFEAWRASQARDVALLRTRILRALVDALATEPFRALPHAHALQAMDPDNPTLAAELKRLEGSARELATKPSEANRDGTPRLANDDASTAIPPALSTGDATPRQVTVLSVEIVTPLHGLASVSSGAMLRQMDPLLEAAHRIIERQGGVIIASGNFSITALFDSSASQDAVAACRAALAVKSAIESLSAGTVRVRAGLDSGEVAVRFRRHGVNERIEATGAPVRTAARLVHSLRRGILALTDRTHVAVAGAMATGLLPRSDLPRFSRDEQAYELLAEQSGEAIQTPGVDRTLPP